MKEKKKYLSARELDYQLIVSKSQGKLTREAEKMLILLGKKIIGRFSYKNPDDKLDCLQTGYIQLFSYWMSFDENKGDSFSWATEVFKRGAAQGWNKIYAQKGIKGQKVGIISLSGYDADGRSYERF